MQEEARAALAERGFDPRDRGGLGRCRLADVAAAADRFDRRAPLDAGFVDDHQPARLEPPEVAVADERRGQRARREPLQRLALLHAQPRLARQGVAPLGRELGAKRPPRAGALLRPGAGARWEHEREATRRRRDVLLGGPQAEPHEIGRHAALERLDRLDELLGRDVAALSRVYDHAEHAPAAERHQEHAADAGLHAVRHPIVERAP